MRLTQLGLQHYGNFAELDLNFTAPPGCIELLVAPNGAGKSVLRQAICELLFGVHPTTKMGFRFGYPRMRLRAQAITTDGGQLGFVRRKGNLNTLTDLAGGAADARLLGHLPRPGERERLERLFALDSAQLVAGGKALLQSGGDLADALLSGAGELRSARTLVADLNALRDAIAPRRRSEKLAFHEAGDALKAAQLRLQAGLIRPQDWAAREQARDAAAARLAEANALALAEAATLRRLQRVRGTRHDLDALQHATAWLAEHPDAPMLPPDLGARLAAAEGHAATAQARHAERQSDAATLAAQCAALALDEPALAEEPTIAALTAESGLARQSRLDMPLLHADRDAVDVTIAGLLRQLGSPRDPAAAADEIRPVADIEAARRLIVQHVKLAAATADGPESAARLRRSIADHEAALAALPPPTQTEEVDALVAEITADGQPATLMTRARRAAADAAEAVRAALARVPGGSAGAAMITALATPSDAAFNRLDQAMQAAANSVQQAGKERDRDAAAVKRLQRTLTEQTAAGPLPDRQAVQNARSFRDKGWRLIRQRLAGEPVTAEQERDFAGSDTVVQVYTRAVEAADAVADRRAEEMARVERATQCAAELAEAERAWGQSQATADMAAATAERARAAWAATCGGIGLPAEATLAEVRAFLAARSAVIDAAGVERRAVAEQAALEQRHTAWALRLASLLDGAGPQIAQPGSGAADIAVALGAAKLLLQRAQAAESQRSGLRGLLHAAQASLREQQAAQAEAQHRFALWSAEWEAALTRLRRPPGEHPEIAGPVLDLLLRLEPEVAKAASLTLRLAQMQAQLDGFATRATALGARLAMVGGGDAITTVEAAQRRLDQARAEKSRSDTLREQAAAMAREAHEAAAQVQAAGRAMAELLRQAGTDDLAAAKHRIALSEQRRDHADKRQAALDRLREDGDGLSPAALQAEADAAPADTLLAQIAETEAAMQAAHQDAQQAAAQEADLRRDLQALGENGDASRAAADLAAAQSRLGRVLEDALVHHTAAAMLEEALQTVEATGDDPRLARIGAAFSALTTHAYDRVSAGDKGEDSKRHRVLLAHEVGGDEKLVDELSEGTRDQLYLALRLVAIEDHVAAAAPLPFIADDILQTFDDARALAAFDALLALSVHTQVIVLTHHEHLAALAQTLKPGSVAIQRLGRP